jgi:hypothetical protein
MCKNFNPFISSFNGIIQSRIMHVCRNLLGAYVQSKGNHFTLYVMFSFSRFSIETIFIFQHFLVPLKSYPRAEHFYLSFFDDDYCFSSSFCVSHVYIDGRRGESIYLMLFTSYARVKMEIYVKLNFFERSIQENSTRKFNRIEKNR